MGLLLLIIILLLLFGGVGGTAYWVGPRYPYGGGLLGVALVIVAIVVICKLLGVI